MTADERAQAKRGRRRNRTHRFTTVLEQLEGRALLSTIFANSANTTGIEDGTPDHPFSHIQAAIDGATAGDVISIAPGVYAENLTVDRPVTLEGPNAGVDPNHGSRQAEAVLVPAANNPPSGRMILVKANDVTIEGLTLDGNNPDLPAGVMVNGVSANAASGIANVDSAGALTPISGLTVDDNIIRNLTSFAVMADINDFSVSAPRSVSSGNTISDNLIDNIPDNVVDVGGVSTPNPGRGISIEDNFYADVTGNVITRVGTGIQAIFMVNPSTTPGASQITGNSVEAYTYGIFLNTIDSDNLAFNVANNSIAIADDPQTTPGNVGLFLDHILGSSDVTVVGNDVSGADVGVGLQYITTSQEISVQGGTLSGNGDGVELSNTSRTGDPVAAVRASLAGVTIAGSTAAGLVYADNLGQAGSTVTLTVDAATTVSGSPHGAVRIGPHSALVETVKPTVAFTSTPPVSTASTSASFAFTAGDNITTGNDLVVEYAVDASVFQNASSPLSLSNLSVGTHTIAVRVTDQAGNTASAIYTWAVTAPQAPAAPSAPFLVELAQVDPHIGDGITNDDTPTFTGTAPAGSTVTLYAGANVLGTAPADPTTGQWSFTVGGAGSSVASLADGSYAITATDAIGGGPVSQPSAAASILIDTVNPTIAFTSTPPANTTSTSATFTFAASDDVSSGDDLLYAYSLDGPQFSPVGSPLALDGLAVGTHHLVVRVTDQAGNTATAVDDWTVTPPAPPAAPSAPALAAASDTGASNTDGITKDNAPTFVGTATAGSTVTLHAGETVLGSTTADPSTGAWSFTVGGDGSIVTSFADGSYSITATASLDGSPASEPSVTSTIRIDTTGPTIAFTTTPPATTTSTSASLSYAVADDVSPAGQLLVQYALDGAGFQDASNPLAFSGLSVGSHSVAVLVRDQAGNTASAVDAWTINQPPPPAAPSSPALAAASDTGASSTDGITKDNAPTFVGTAPAGSTVTLYTGETVLGSTTADPTTGAWSFTVGGSGSIVTSFADGSYSITATASLDGSPASEPSAPGTIRIDTTGPTIAFTTTPPATTTSTSATVSYVATDDVSHAGQLVVQYALDGSGFRDVISSLVFSDLSAGPHSVAVLVRDQAGNTTTAVDTWTISGPALAPPSTPALAASSDTGASNSDGITNDSTPTFAGSAPAGSTVTIFAGTTALGTTGADSSGRWSFTVGGPGSNVPRLADGLYAITAAYRTGGGGSSQPSGARTIRIDTVAPAIVAVRIPVANGAGWSNANVVARYAAGDNGSGLASPASGWFAFGSERAGQSHTFRVADIAGNFASATVGSVNIDKTPPLVTVSATPRVVAARAGQRATVIVSGRATDPLSGLGSRPRYVVLNSAHQVVATGTVNLANNATYRFSVALPAPADRRHPSQAYIIAVIGTDAAGNSRMVTTTATVRLVR